MQKLIKRLKREPIVSRAGLAAILNVLVIAGVIDTGASEAVEAAVLAAIDAVALIAARAKVRPEAEVVYAINPNDPDGLFLTGEGAHVAFKD